MMRLMLPVVITSVLLAGCTPISTYQNLTQSTETPITTHVGGQVFKVERSADLPNAMGNADIFGGKVDKGFTELRYQGTAEDGRLVFRLIEIETASNESTMSRYGSSSTSLNAQSYGNQVYGTMTTYDAPDGNTERLPANTTEFAISPERRSLSIGGIVVNIISNDEMSLTYSLTK